MGNLAHRSEFHCPQFELVRSINSVLNIFFNREAVSPIATRINREEFELDSRFLVEITNLGFSNSQDFRCSYCHLNSGEYNHKWQVTISTTSHNQYNKSQSDQTYTCSTLHSTLPIQQSYPKEFIMLSKISACWKFSQENRILFIYAHSKI